MQDAAAARALFPRGLYQPEGSFRFSLDALLLASFAGLVRLQAQDPPGPSPESPELPELSELSGSLDLPDLLDLLDLGCGCGPTGLAFLLDHLAHPTRQGHREQQDQQDQPNTPAVRACGLDFQPELVRAAQMNAARLGFADRYAAFCADLEKIRTRPELLELLQKPAGFDLVTANPPYRLPGSGRQPADESRRLALFGSRENLEAFSRAAALALRPNGAFCVIFPHPRLQELLESLAGHGLHVFRQIDVLSRPGQNPTLVMLAAGFRPEAPAQPETAARPKTPETANPASLCLYREQGGLSRQALEFCPHLACNSQN